jgi:hypothetical protein
VDRVKVKSPSMKARGVAFAIEAISNINVPNSEDQISKAFSRLEKVVQTKIDEFIPHYLIKILCAYTKAGQGSGELFDLVITHIIKALPNEEDSSVKYSDMIRFFEVFPDVSYIYDHTMNSELYKIFLRKIKQVLGSNRFPTEDLCRVFNILVHISPYSQFNDQETLTELIGRMRHSLYSVPKEHFACTIANLIELQQPAIAAKMATILLEHPSFPN